MTTDEKGTAMRVPPSRDDDTPSERTPEPARVHRQMPNSLAPTACPCASCVAEAGVSAWWMIVCDECGNKRCPHGTDHRHECTGSNEPGQVGSGYARMTSDAHIETITDRAAIRDSDEPDERTPNEVHVDESGCSCKTGPYRGFQRDPIDAACPKHGGPLRHGDGDVTVCHPDGSTTIIREPSEAEHLESLACAVASVTPCSCSAQRARAEAAEAEVVTLRVKLAAVEAVHVRCGEGVCNAGPKPEICHECGVAWPCPTFAALAVTTGEGQ